MNKFLDTSSLLLIDLDSLFQDNIYISSITLEELEQIKTSAQKDENIKYIARKLLQKLNNNMDKYQVIIFQEKFLKPILKRGYSITNDTKILSCALFISKTTDLAFITNDLNLKQIANTFSDNFSSINSIKEKKDNYTGYKEIKINDDKIAELYENPTKNSYNLLTNQYLILKNNQNEVIDKLCWTGKEYRQLKFKDFNSKWFGKVRPIKGDIYQQLLFDSLTHNQFTIIRGHAGVGKSMIALAYLVYKLEQGDIDNITIFCNPIATRDAAKLGFLPGDKNTKLLDSQVGSFLASKFGGIEMIQQLIEQGVLNLIPVADARGVSIKPYSGVYVTEAQNTSIDVMQLILQRIEEKCICIIEGDDQTQVDLISYMGNNNGLRKASQVFRGQDYYGEVYLPNCYRSRLAAQAELMKLR